MIDPDETHRMAVMYVPRINNKLFSNANNFSSIGARDTKTLPFGAPHHDESMSFDLSFYDP
jgi:hypothetical protein